MVFGLNINRSNSEQTIPLTPVVPGAGEEAQSMVLSPEKGEEEAMVLGGGEMVEEVEAFIPGKDPEGEMIFVPEEEVVIPEDEEMMRGGEEEGMVLGGIFVPEEEVVVPEEEEMMRGGEEEGMVLGGVFVPEEEVAVPEEEEMMRGGEEEGMVLGGVFVPEEEVVVPEEEVVVPEEEEMMRGGEEEGMVLGGIFVPEEEVVVPEEEVVVPEEEEMMRGGEEEGMVLGGVFVPEEEMVVVGDKGGEEEEMALGGGMTLRGSIPEGEEEGGIVFVPEEEMVVPDKSSMVPDGEEVAPWEDEEGFMQSPGTLPSAETHVGHGDDGFEANVSFFDYLFSFFPFQSLLTFFLSLALVLEAFEEDVMIKFACQSSFVVFPQIAHFSLSISSILRSNGVRQEGRDSWVKRVVGYVCQKRRL